MATDINHVVLVGRLTRDAELKYTPSGMAVSKLGIAVNRSKKVEERWEEEANFFDVTVWGRQAEALNQYLLKGKQIGVDGELRQERWVQDGANRSKVTINANNIQLLAGGPGAVAGQAGQNPAYQAPPSSPPQAAPVWAPQGARPAGRQEVNSPPPVTDDADPFSTDIPF